MSVKINELGQLVVTSEKMNAPEENYNNRLKALINILKYANYENLQDTTFWDVLDILEDYLPTAKQSKIMFNTTEENAENIKNMLRELNGKIDQTEATKTEKQVLTTVN